METAELQSIPRQPFDGFGGAAAERRDGGVIEVNQPLGDWKLVLILPPQRFHLVSVAKGMNAAWLPHVQETG